jgi:RNA polymerase sigma-70 factor (ECF subfamily)
MSNSNPHQAASELVRRAKAGDRRAFGELVRRYRDRIFALCLHLTGNQSDADDVTQEVFLKAYHALDTFEGRSQFFTWVYRMAVNRSLNVTRARKRRAAADIDDPRLERALAVDAGKDPVRAAELRETYSRLLSELDKMPAAMRATVVLVALQGLSHAEAAIVQKCSQGTIAWRIHTARARLKKSLGNGEAPIRRVAANKPISNDLINLLKEWGLPVLVPHGALPN